MAGGFGAIASSLITAGSQYYADRKQAKLQEKQQEYAMQQEKEAAQRAETAKKQQIKSAGEEVKRKQKRRRVYRTGTASLLQGSGADRDNMGLG